jgi:hypothetical protein
MLDDLERHSHNTTDLRDRLPYVLDLLAGVTRTVALDANPAQSACGFAPVTRESIA